MKTKLFLVFIALIFACPIFGQSGDTKRVAILETVDKEGKVPYGIKLMVRSILCEVITEVPGYEGYDRVDIASILGEQDFQRTGLVSDKDIKRLGEMTGAGFILVAEVAYLNSSYIFLSAKILDVETARVEQTASTQTQSSVDELVENCKILACKLLNVNVETGSVKGELIVDGNRYVGEYKNGKPHGKGTMFYTNLKSYEGDWVDGKREGKGTLIWSDGSRYEGDWVNDKRHGHGKLTYASNDSNVKSYEGDWVDDKRKGKGTMIWNSGSRYEGDWVNGNRHGHGKLTYASNDSYNRKSYEGDWVDDKREGKGTLIWNDGSRYEGDWVDGNRHGHGKLTYASNDSYNRKSYEGDWVDDKREGKGTLIWNDGDKRVGSYKDGKGEGSATYYFTNGNYCKEFLVNGKLHGAADYYYSNGHKYMTKIYEDGVLIKTKNYR